MKKTILLIVVLMLVLAFGVTAKSFVVPAHTAPSLIGPTTSDDVNESDVLANNEIVMEMQGGSPWADVIDSDEPLEIIVPDTGVCEREELLHSDPSLEKAKLSTPSMDWYWQWDVTLDVTEISGNNWYDAYWIIRIPYWVTPTYGERFTAYDWYCPADHWRPFCRKHGGVQFYGWKIPIGDIPSNSVVESKWFWKHDRTDAYPVLIANMKANDQSGNLVSIILPWNQRKVNYKLTSRSWYGMWEVLFQVDELSGNNWYDPYFYIRLPYWVDALNMDKYPDMDFICTAAHHTTCNVPGGIQYYGWKLAISDLPAHGTLTFDMIAKHYQNQQYIAWGYVKAYGDNDNDGIHNCMDECPDAAGTEAFGGCQAAVQIKADRHNIQTGSHPGSTKTPIVGLNIGIYDRAKLQDGTACGGMVITAPANFKNYETIVRNCIAVKQATTDSNGLATIRLPAGIYDIISFVDGATDVDKHLGTPVVLLSGDIQDKYLQFIIKGDGKTIPGKTKRVKGSELLIIEPEYIEWASTQELYPIVFETLDTWTTETSVTPPEGYSTDYGSLDEQVTNEVEVIQFTITEVGSKPGSTFVMHKVKGPNGRTVVIKSGIPAEETPAYTKAKGKGKGITGFAVAGLGDGSIAVVIFVVTILTLIGVILLLRRK